LAYSLLGFENEIRVVNCDTEDLRKKVEKALPSEIAALLEARSDISDCLSARLRERFAQESALHESEAFLGGLGHQMTESNFGQATFLQPEMLPCDTDGQNVNLDFELGDLSFMNHPITITDNRTYQDGFEKGYEAGHEQGYQQGQRDGYNAGKQAAQRRSVLSPDWNSSRMSDITAPSGNLTSRSGDSSMTLNQDGSQFTFGCDGGVNLN
jgi:hypothetical protein